jgi:hypothetical protein
MLNHGKLAPYISARASANDTTSDLDNPRISDIPSGHVGDAADNPLSRNDPLREEYMIQTSYSILANPSCSGYFLEPVRIIVASSLHVTDHLRVLFTHRFPLTSSQMEWMEPFLEQGQLSGKILCPNKKCGVKLGNYDWAGVCCGCKEWVTPVSCGSPHLIFRFLFLLFRAHLSITFFIRFNRDSASPDQKSMKWPDSVKADEYIVYQLPLIIGGVR